MDWRRRKLIRGCDDLVAGGFSRRQGAVAGVRFRGGSAQHQRHQGHRRSGDIVLWRRDLNFVRLVSRAKLASKRLTGTVSTPEPDRRWPWCLWCCAEPPLNRTPATAPCRLENPRSNNISHPRSSFCLLPAKPLFPTFTH